MVAKVTEGVDGTVGQDWKPCVCSQEAERGVPELPFFLVYSGHNTSPWGPTFGGGSILPLDFSGNTFADMPRLRLSGGVSLVKLMVVINHYKG